MVISNRDRYHPPLYFNGKDVGVVEEHKHLGVTFNHKLNWKDHIQNIVSSISKFLDVMHKLAKDLDRKSLETVYQTFVRSKIEYACIIWDDCSEQLSTSLEKCQLRAGRIISGAKRGTSHASLYSELQWPTLSARRDAYKLCFMHKVVNKTAPDYLIEILPNTVNANRHYELRNDNNIEQFFCRTEKFRKSLFPDGIRKWNRLDNDLKTETSFNSFRNKVNATASCSP